MSDDIENKQEAPANDALLNNDVGTDEQKADSSTESEVKTEGTEGIEEKPKVWTEEEVKKELDNRAAKIREIAERKARREAETKLRTEMESKQATQPNVVQQNIPYNQIPPDYIQDPLLGCIHKDTSVDQYRDMLIKTYGNTEGQAVNNQQSAQQMAPINNGMPKYSQNAIDQIDECDVEYKDDADAISVARFMTADMVNAACLASDGLKKLIEYGKSNPTELVKIARLSPHEQSYKIWELQQKLNEKNKKKVVTQVDAQPKSLSQGEGSVQKTLAEMSIQEKMRAYVDNY